MGPKNEWISARSIESVTRADQKAREWGSLVWGEYWQISRAETERLGGVDEFEKDRVEPSKAVGLSGGA